MNGTRHYLWRAVDQDGHVLDLLVQSRRNKHAAKTCFRTLLKGLMYVPRVIVTDRLPSYAAAPPATASVIRSCISSRNAEQSPDLAGNHESSHRGIRAMIEVVMPLLARWSC